MPVEPYVPDKFPPGVYSAWPSAFYDSGGLNVSGMAGVVRYTLENGCAGGVVAGCSGCSFQLSDDERAEAAFFIYNLFKGLYPEKEVIIGTGLPDTGRTIELSKRIMRETGATDFMLIEPYGSKPTQEGIERHYRTSADVLANIDDRVRIIAYTVATRTGAQDFGISPATAIAIAEHPNIVAIKLASRAKYPKGREGRRDFLDSAKEMIEGGVVVYSGDDGETIPLVELGADGVISVASNPDPRRVSEMTKCALNGDLREARRYAKELRPLVSALFPGKDPNPVALHYMLGEMGFPIGNPRLPLLPASKATRRKADRVRARLGLPYQD